MLRINRLRIEINTIKGIFGIDETFQDGLTFISSLDNTCGKSSILAAIYYCLGFEQILGGAGGVGSKVLTSAFKTIIEDDKESLTVTESGAYLEINNGNETRTIYRSIKSESKDNRLVTVYYGDYDSIYNHKTLAEDFYVNVQSSATSKKGFHTCLEEFLHMELPLVQTSDGNERKLYLQVIFASMFIEQKHGWSDILSGMPVFGIRESKKRIVEYILGLDTLNNEKERDQLKTVKTKLEHKWHQVVSDFEDYVNSELCEVINLPTHPRVLSDIDYSRIVVSVMGESSVEEEIQSLKNMYNNLRQLKPRVCDNYDALNIELSETQKQILVFENRINEIEKDIASYDEAIKRLTADLEVVSSDIRNNTDAARLQKFGSETVGGDISVDICPVCKQQIQDNLFDAKVVSGFMSIEDNIRHLKEQKKMLEFTLRSRKESREIIVVEKNELEMRLQRLRKLAFAIRSDLFSTVDTEASEAIMLKRIEISNRIEQLSKLKDKTDYFLEQLKELSIEWRAYIDRKGRLPKSDISDSDNEKIILLKKKFIDNLIQYHYSSLSSFDGIDISMKSSLLPTIDGFDMKFDSSASDGIRVIWAFTLALLQVSIEKNGNHPSIIIFDEPAQHSIVPEDIKSFIESVMNIKGSFQIVTAITLNSQDLKSMIDELDASNYHIVQIEGKAFKAL